jgi:hypothetical protein
MNDIFRNRLRKYDKASDIVSGLVLQNNEYHIITTELTIGNRGY